ncbi:MAG: hypothetical protein BWZ02_00851 [Lentisphaerae bacterium ADurb.BinA184]|nr:MAG: hypothetical protein BWZ02_00851 [Lentisphaerae bacterium ADurb.BinA184]
MMKHVLFLAVAALALACAVSAQAAEPVPPSVEPWRIALYEAWKKLPDPPVTPYDGPFGGEARAFVGKVDWKLADQAAVANWKAQQDYGKSAKNGVYDPAKDPRPINTAFEEAMLDDWNRMGYNCAYKGASFTFMVGSFLKSRGLLGAIDQTLWGANGPPPLQFDGKEGSRQREACGSFFDAANYQAGVAAITGMGHFYGHHLFTVGDHRLTCSWDEVGLRTRAQMDYRDPMRAEFRAFVKDVWFGDASPGEDSNRDGRTYNALTGQSLKSWDEVEPVQVSLDWTAPGYDPVKKDGTRIFSAMPETDTVMYREPGRYKLLIDFHRYYTFEFFRRINEEASQAVNRLGSPGRVSCYPFTQHFIIWPGANQRHGNSFYWYHRLSPVVNVEHCWPEAPVMNLNYAITDRLAPRHRNTVMGWIWFYFGQEGHDQYNGPHDMDRALARMMGHTVDGTHHWLYSPRYRSRDQKQRLQIAYWQNFFKAHYAGFLAKSAPVRPQIALLMPDTTGYFYRYFQYPKQDFGWTAEALQNLQYPWHLLTEEEIELGETKLGDYKALYVVGSEWSTPTIRQRIAEFIAGGGVVFANVDSLTLDVATGKRIDFLEKHFGVKIARKHKNAFYPSTQTAEEAVWAVPFDTWGGPFKLQGHSVHDLDDPRAWARLYARTEQKYLLDENGKPRRPIPDNQGMQGGQPMRDPSWTMLRDATGKLVRDEAVWKQLDEAMARMPSEVLGIAQSPLDMRTPPVIRYAEALTAVGTAVTWGEVDEASPVGDAKPIAWWGDKVVGVETPSTVWLGTREGMSLHAISSRMEAHRGTEPCNPFPSEIPELHEANRPYAEALGYAARKAGVTRPVTLTLDGKLPMNLEVLPRLAADGTMMVVVISHDKTEAEYDVAVDAALVKKGALAWSMLDEREIETDTDGQFKLKVPSWGVAVFMVGPADALKPVQAAQAKLNTKDMSVPKYFADRPALNEYEWGTPVPPIEP